MTVKTIYDQYHQRIVNYARGRFGMQECDAEQIASDVFLQLHKTLQNGVEIRDPGAWLRKAARSARIDWLRYHNRKKRHVKTRIPLSKLATEDVEFERVDTRDTVTQALMFLSDDERACLKLAYYDQLDHPQAAKQLGITTPAFQRRVSRARCKLRAVLT